MMGAELVCIAGSADALPGLDHLLLEAGFATERLPVLSFAPPADDSLERAAGLVHAFAAIAITSPRAASALAAAVGRIPGYDRNAAPPAWTSATSAAALAAVTARVNAPALPSGSLGLRLAEAMLRAGVGTPVLFPCGAEHRDELALRLRAAGRRVVPVEAYRAVLHEPAVCQGVLARASIVVVTSPRVALHLASLSLPVRPLAVAIGPTTARAARQAGWPASTEALEPTPAGVVRAIHQLALSRR